jgi:glycosyltransferase involved in cell wall biosynthesis
MNVLFVTREYPPFEVGGIAVHTFNLVKNLVKLGVSCKVVTFGNRKMSTENVVFVDPSSSILERSNSPLASNFRIPFDILRFSQVANALIDKEQFDIVHVEEPYVGAFIAGNGKPTKVSTFHTTSFGEITVMLGHSFSSSSLKRLLFYSSLGFFLESMSIASSGALIVPTTQVRNELTRIYRTPFDKIELIENGVDLPDVGKINNQAEAKKELGLSPKTFLIVSMARIVARKRLDILVKAIKILQKAKPHQFHVIIGGDGPDRPLIRQLVDNYGLEQITELPGWVSNEQKERFYQAADVFVLSSEYEGFPLTLLEAMSYGVAVVASKINSLCTLREGVDGLFFPIGDCYKLSECIVNLMNDSRLRSRLSDSARMFAANYDWKNTAEQTKKFYESLT